MPEIRGVQMGDPGRRRRHGEGPIRPLALLKGATDHDLRGTEIIVAADEIVIVEVARVSPSAVAIVALLLALRYFLTRFIYVLRRRRRCRLRGQVQL